MQSRSKANTKDRRQLFVDYLQLQMRLIRPYAELFRRILEEVMMIEGKIEKIKQNVTKNEGRFNI